MKTLLLLGAAALSLAGCDGAKCDTGDSACGVSGDVTIKSMDGICSGATCSWEVVTNGESGMVELDLAETGDTSGSCQTDPNCSPEGFWTEFHDEFNLVDFDDSAGTETKEINLGLVSSFDQQVQNETTIFDVSDPTISNQLTVLYTVYDKDGAYADCAVFGHDPSYFDCANNANLW